MTGSQHIAVLFSSGLALLLYFGLGDEPLNRFIRVFHRVLIPITSREFCLT